MLKLERSESKPLGYTWEEHSGPRERPMQRPWGMVVTGWFMRQKLELGDAGPFGHHWVWLLS